MRALENRRQTRLRAFFFRFAKRVKMSSTNDLNLNLNNNNNNNNASIALCWRRTPGPSAGASTLDDVNDESVRTHTSSSASPVDQNATDSDWEALVDWASGDVPVPTPPPPAQADAATPRSAGRFRFTSRSRSHRSMAIHYKPSVQTNTLPAVSALPVLPGTLIHVSNKLLIFLTNQILPISTYKQN